MEDFKPNYKTYCDMCERYTMVCGSCGNNTCNGGYGTLPDGSECKMCKLAYLEELTEISSELGLYDEFNQIEEQK